MPPTSARDFQNAAEMRLRAAHALHAAGFHLDAQYLGGYAVECALKALILHETPDAERAATLTRITSGASMHRSEVLLGKVRDLGVDLPEEIADQMDRFVWTTSLRYESQERGHEATELFLVTARLVFNWVEGFLP